jgi:predicted amidohydrolase
MRVGVAQLESTDDVAANLASTAEVIAEAGRRNSAVVVLPEAFSYRGPFACDLVQEIDGPVGRRLAELARRHNVAVLAGGLWTTCPDPKRAYNTSLLVDRLGNLVASYHKIHLFRLDRPDGSRDDEADFTLAGDEPVVADLDGVRLGLTICYDIRFPELYRTLASAGATVLCAPSNFSDYTGTAHWETLLRARAIENLAFVLAPAQRGTDSTGFAAHGNSLIIDPWGTVLARASQDESLIIADLDLAAVKRRRAQLRSADHIRPDVYVRTPIGVPTDG